MTSSTRCSARAALALLLLGVTLARAQEPSAQGAETTAPAAPPAGAEESAAPATAPSEAEESAAPATAPAETGESAASATAPAPAEGSTPPAPGSGPGKATPAATAPGPAKAPPPTIDLADKALLRLIVMPIENLSGAFVPGRELQHDIEEALLSRFDLVRGEEQERFLSRRRLRWTGGLDAASALAARQELGADAVLITTVTIYREGPPPVLALTMRLVATGDDPSIVWMETASKAGDDEPGVLGLGLVDDLKVLRGLLLGRLFASMEEAREGRGNRMGGLCDSDRWSRPRVAFRSPLLDGAEMRRAAVLPLLNRSGRRGAGEAMSLELVRQLAASGRYRVLEPGVVRDFLLSRRIMVPGGVSLETSRLFVGVLGVDLLFSGSILDYDETGLPRGPTIRFNLVGLEGGTGEVVWSSTSFSHGDDGVYFFGAGRVATASQLSCRMMGGVMQRLLGVGGSSPLPPLDRALRDRLLHPGGIQAYVPPTQPWPGSGQ